MMRKNRQKSTSSISPVAVTVNPDESFIKNLIKIGIKIFNFMAMKL